MIDDTYSFKTMPGSDITLERDVEKHLVNGIKKLGGVAYKFTSPQRRSVPDRLIVLPGNRIIFVEVKREGKTAGKSQQREIDRLRNLGAEVLVLAGMKEVKHFLEEIEDEYRCK